MEQAKGKVFAFTDSESTSGYFLPSIVLVRDFKIEPKTYFKEIKLSGSHVNSIMGVKDGSIDMAAISESQIDRLAEKGEVSRDDFVILRRSELIPGICMATRKGLPESLRDALKNALLKFGDDKEAAKKIDIGGFQQVDDKMYDIIRELERLKKEMKGKK